METKPIVSVCMITYVHENFIREAIEGVLMQECDFEVELIVANDCSPDQTDAVIEDILQNHPRASWIKYVKHETNIGMMPNFIFALQQCKGKYIALCEGDDYWTDPLKLQKQVNFLENNSDYVLCFHKVKILEGTIFKTDNIENRFDKIINLPATKMSLLEIGNFIHTPSAVFRNIISYFSSEFKYSSVGDYFLYIILAEYGNIHRIEEYMAVYRKGVGVYSSLNPIEMQSKILVYQSCILSFLSKESEKEIILKKNINSINNYKKLIVNYSMSNAFLSKELSFRKIIRIFFLKLIKYKKSK